MCNPFESRHRRKLSKISSISRPRRGGTRSHAATSTSTHFDSDQYVTAESVPTRQWDLHPDVYCPQPCLVFLHDAPICMAQCFEALEHHRAEGCLYAKSIYCLQSSSTLSLKAGQHFRGAAWLQSTMSRRTASAAVSSCRPRSAAVFKSCMARIACYLVLSNASNPCWAPVGRRSSTCYLTLSASTDVLSLYEAVHLQYVCMQQVSGDNNVTLDNHQCSAHAHCCARLAVLFTSSARCRAALSSLSCATGGWLLLVQPAHHPCTYTSW